MEVSILKLYSMTKRNSGSKSAAIPADLYAYGKKVFGDKKRFDAWMNDPNRALGGKTPLELIVTQSGLQEVKNIIGRIEWGVYS
jgi:putative toxin-antitoxin system antitoxin component (TIGR02293 family)